MLLAIESTCDETATALFDPAAGVAGEWVHSQIALHERHGGVVPDLAAREHLRHLGPLVGRAFGAAGGPISGIAVANGPGLAACLAMGVAAGKALSLALGVPLFGVNHLRAHAWSPFLAIHAGAPGEFAGRLGPLLPHLGLIVSGGHTLLFRMGPDRRIEVLSSTRDDAAGEALDKGAKLLGLGYPGGPIVERTARGGRDDAFDFPRGIDRRGELDFSFSGLKTSLRYRIEKMAPLEVAARMPDLCASYQRAVVEALAGKAESAVRAGAYRSIGLSGGVSANARLRSALEGVARGAGIPLLAAAPAHTGDNAAMIGFAAWADPLRDAESGISLAIAPGLGLAG
jgi:N6-L-threonylcarbamoyladenine synthase